MTTLTISYKKSSCNHKGTEWGEFAHSNVYRRHGCRELDPYSVTLLIRIQPGKKTEKWEEKKIKEKNHILTKKFIANIIVRFFIFFK